MQFAPPRPARPARENIVPMINVVFLLLIFFLMTAQIAPPEPFAVTPPGSESRDPAGGPATLWIASDGAMAFGTARGEAVFAALADHPRDAALLIRADATLPARDVAALLPRLAALGLRDVALITEVAR